MKTRIFLIAILLSVTPFLQSSKAPEKLSAAKKMVWVDYCGYISAGCPAGSIEVRIASDGTTAYLLAVTAGGSPIQYHLNSISVVSGSSNVFSLNLDYKCTVTGSWVNYVGGAYTMVCP